MYVRRRRRASLNVTEGAINQASERRNIESPSKELGAHRSTSLSKRISWVRLKKGGKQKSLDFRISSGFIFLASSQLTLSGRPDCFISIRAHKEREQKKNRVGSISGVEREREQQFGCPRMQQQHPPLPAGAIKMTCYPLLSVCLSITGSPIFFLLLLGVLLLLLQGSRHHFCLLT